MDLQFYFYRDRDGNEIDLLIEDNSIRYPVEIKKHAGSVKTAIIKFELLNKIADISCNS